MKRQRTKQNTDANVGGLPQLDMMRNMFQTLSQGMLSERSGILSKLGSTFAGNRLLYTECGYPLTLEFNDYDARYERQDIAKRIINAYPEATWGNNPSIFETDDDEETEFEKAWKQLAKGKRLKGVFPYLSRVDKLSGIGRYAVLLMGFNDVKKPEDLAKPVRKGTATKLLYLQPYDEVEACIQKPVTDPGDERYGLPEFYTLRPTTMLDNTTHASTIIKCHWSRIIHVAEDTVRSDIYSAPKLKAIWNRLQDMETIVGGTAEMFWKTGFPGFVFTADPDYHFDKQDKADLADEFEGYYNHLQRLLRLQGGKLDEFKSRPATPKDILTAEFQLISACTGIPMRILLGSERGELASSQDAKFWFARVGERRVTYAEPSILRVFIDRLIEFGLLPEVEEYKVKWHSLAMVDEKSRADVAKTQTESLKMYVDSGSEMVIPPFQYLTEILGLDQDKVRAILEAADDHQKDVDDDEPVEDKPVIKDESGQVVTKE